MRFADFEYHKPTIGTVRRDLWNAAFMLAYHENVFDEPSGDIIGINNDIDANRISPHYIARIQQAYKRRQARYNQIGTPNAPLPHSYTRVTHTVLPSHPNVGKVTTWIDNTIFQNHAQVGYDAGLVIPFSQYAYTGGIAADKATYEMAPFTRRSSATMITGAHMWTSPRRYIERVDDNGSNGIWTDESFTDDDDCRTRLRPDISHERAEELIADRLEYDIKTHWFAPITYKSIDDVRSMTAEDLLSTASWTKLLMKTSQNAERQMNKADRILRKLIGSNLLSDILKENINGPEYARNTIFQLIAQRQVLEEQDAF